MSRMFENDVLNKMIDIPIMSGTIFANTTEITLNNDLVEGCSIRQLKLS